MVAHRSRLIPMTFFDSLEDARLQLSENALLALESQAELAEFLDYPRSMESYQTLIDESTGGGSDTQFRELRSRHVHTAVKQSLQTATTYYVSPDMCEMVGQAADSMPSEGLNSEVLPSPQGWLFFARPLVLWGPGNLPGESDGSMQEVRISAILWRRDIVGATGDSGHWSAEGVSYYLFTNANDMAVMNNQLERNRLQLATGTSMPEPIMEEFRGPAVAGDSPFATEQDVRQVAGPYPIYDFSGWAFGQAWHTVPYTEEDSLRRGGVFANSTDMYGPVINVHPIVDQARRVLLATWLLLGQTVTEIEHRHPPRHLQRRVSRRIPEVGDVLIVRLRRELANRLHTAASPDGEPWFNHRFMVRGHWRNQACGPNRSGHKLVWIEPYIKGPEDRPIVLKDKIFSLEV